MRRVHLAGLAAICFSSQAFGAGDLPLIKTAAELRALPTIHLSSGWDARVGYADPGSDAGPWVLVYCDLSHEKGVPEEIKISGGDLVGPLDIWVNWDKEKSMPQKAMTELRLSDGIYVRAVPTLRKGLCHIDLQDGNASVAHKDLNIEEVKPLYWQTLVLSFGKKRPLEGGKAPLTADVSAGAIPQFGGTRAALDGLMREDFLADLLKSGLPGTLPMNPAWDSMKPDDLKDKAGFPLKMSFEKGQFVIEHQGAELMDWPDETLLARWWVNGKPIETPFGDKPPHLQDARQVVTTHRMTVQAEYPESLGAVKEGDKIGLQVMYAPFGFSTSSMLELRAPDVMDGVRMPLLSNKIEFPLTRDMIEAHKKALAE